MNIVALAVLNRSGGVAVISGNHEQGHQGDFLPYSGTPTRLDNLARGRLGVGITNPNELCSISANGTSIVVYYSVVDAYDELGALVRSARWAKLDELTNFMVGVHPDIGSVILRSLRSIIGMVAPKVTNNTPPHLSYQLFSSWEMGFKDGVTGFRGHLNTGIPVNPSLYDAYSIGFQEGEQARDTHSRAAMERNGFSPNIFQEHYGDVPTPWATIK